MFFYAVIGEFLFADLITTDSVSSVDHSASNLYYLMNFNDLYASMITLFHILVVNNWNETTDLYCAITGNSWPRLYFTTFWVICTLIMLNIVISFVLEIYGSIEDEMEVEERKKALARRLMARFKDDPDGIELAEFVHQVAAEERRMIFGVNYEGDDFFDQISRKESGAERTMKGRRNSMDALFSNKADQSKEKKKKK